ncbi:MULTISPECIES: hypothetical protein [Bacillus]|uniref:Lipopolysaccharide assembly protein A domain-containing protein n=1 Tax=Bacillus pumilus (strain SAFR-032) TaxID=315750 RepID=A8FH99_BACP2|nr:MULTISPECIES: hypothetical protein [Bacillus]ABV63616.1 hypothetical protein BPUM_2962 [Bacillus pumilus SAFR-032]AMM98674.1 hypothetical protein UP12_15535 [Bacillus pumilus]AVI42311.1 hypothetical protein C5Y82_15370 [Bacillus pumilus]KMY20711.1 hypothetical protein TW93_06710 [Bacillus pumilus]KRU18059.1 hypothetical protein AS142_03675 [Bacillus pumilus]
MKRALLSAGILFLILGILLLVVVFMQSKEDFFIEADSFSSTFLIVIYYGQTPALLLIGGGIFVGLSQIIGLQEKKAALAKESVKLLSEMKKALEDKSAEEQEAFPVPELHQLSERPITGQKD